jgi:hypothetical protein
MVKKMARDIALHLMSFEQGCKLDETESSLSTYHRYEHLAYTIAVTADAFAEGKPVKACQS